MRTVLPPPTRHPLPARPAQVVRPTHHRALSNGTDISVVSRRSSFGSAMGNSPVLVSPNPGMTPLRKLGKLADVVLDAGRIENLQLVNALRQPLAQAPIFALLDDDVAHRSAAVEDLRQWSGETLREVLRLEEALLTHNADASAIKLQKLQPSRPAVCVLIAAALHLCGRDGGRRVVDAAQALIEPGARPEERGMLLLLALASAVAELAASEGAQATPVAPALLKRRCGATLRNLRRASPGQTRRLRKTLMDELGRALVPGSIKKLQLPLSGHFEHVERAECLASPAVAASPAGADARPKGLTSYFGNLWGGKSAATTRPA